MRIPEYLADEIRPYLAKYEADFDPATVEYKTSGFLCTLFGLIGQSAITWNGTINYTKNRSFDIGETTITPRGDVTPDRAYVRGVGLATHECYHVLDQRRKGWLTYLIGYAIRWPGNWGGKNHPYESTGHALQQTVLTDPKWVESPPGNR